MNAAFFFEDFCAAVCERVRFKPDRGKIRDELMDHLTDRLEALTARGMDRDEALAAAVAAMGDPAAIGDALDKLHSPGMGWLLVWLGRISRVALAAAVLAAALHSGRLADDLTARYEPGLLFQFLPEDEHLAADFRPTTICHTRDYTLTVDRVLISQYCPEYLGLKCLLRVEHRNPWLRAPALHLWISAVDNLGSSFPSANEIRQEPSTGSQTATYGNLTGWYPFVSYYEVSVPHIPAEARSVTLLFDRYGERAFSLLIPLEGGGGA